MRMQNTRALRISLGVRQWLALGVLAAGVALSYGIFAQAQVPEAPGEEKIETSGIVFPVPELGNCGSKEACKAYCNESANMQACISFAKAHGLMNEDEAERAQKFASRVQTRGGPGGCNSPKSCEAYCSDVSRIDECVKFAEEQGIKDEHIAEAKRIQAYVKSGGALPGGCTSRESCERYCGDFSHAEECAEFARKAGIAQAQSGGGGPHERIPTPEQLRKLKELAERGETPGGCTSKETCEAYCEAEGHFEECIEFGTKAGFIAPEEAEKIKQLGGKGPGGCDSPRACTEFCNNPANQEACFAFAEEHELIPKEELEQARHGFVRLRAGLEQAPLEVQGCLKSVLGPTIIEDIQSGKLVPGPAIGERMRGCFEKFSESFSAAEPFRDAPPEVQACLKEKLGADFDLAKIRSGAFAPTPEMADTFRVCFQSVRFEIPRPGEVPHPGEMGVPGPRMIQEFLRSAPSGVADCFGRVLGADFEKIKSGELQPGPEITGSMQTCFEEFQPRTSGGEPSLGVGEAPPQTGAYPANAFRYAPPRVVECVKNSVEAEVFARLVRGDEPSTEVGQKIGTCFKEFGGGSVPPSTGEPRICIQVLTRACNPETRECKTFPTPCEVPQGWYREGVSLPTEPQMQLQPSEPSLYPAIPDGCYDYASCTKLCSDVASPAYHDDRCVKFRESQSGTSGSGTFTAPLESQTYPEGDASYPTSEPAPSGGGCDDATSCQKVCSDSASPYYTSDTCIKFREYQSSEPRTANPIGNFLGVMLAPFLEIGR